MCQERSKDMSRDREEVRMRGTKVSRKDQNEQKALLLFDTLEKTLPHL